MYTDRKNKNVAEMKGTALDRNFKQNKTVNSEEGRVQACPHS